MSAADSRWKHLANVLERNGPMAGDGFEPDFDQTKKMLQDDCRVLVIGAGGLGCELLKDLALMGFKNIDVIDMDTIDYSNLNRQFLFRKEDVGQPKATVAAKFVNERVEGVHVIPHFKKIQDYDEEFYSQFNIVIAGLDSIPARRWINSTLVDMVGVDEETGEPDAMSIIPFIDGGTEGFKGQARVILPRITSCFECSLDAFPPQVNYPLCTIQNTPRLPQHCIQYVNIIEWPKHKKDIKFDADNPEHMQWMFEKSVARANEFNIQGVTYRLTQGVVKNIIPAIASTNAIIAAAEANEAFKFATSCSSNLNNYMMYNGQNGLYTYTFEYEKKQNCPVCGNGKFTVYCNSQLTLQEWIDDLAEDSRFQLKAPSIRCNGQSIFMQSPESLRKSTEKNLTKKLCELFKPDDVLDITDPVLPMTAIQVTLKFE